MLASGEGSTTWFTSDLHLGHPLVSGIRGFGEDEAGVARHDDTLLSNLRESLQEGGPPVDPRRYLQRLGATRRGGARQDPGGAACGRYAAGLPTPGERQPRLNPPAAHARLPAPAPLPGSLRLRAIDAKPPLGGAHCVAQPLPAPRPGPHPRWFPPRRAAPGCALDAARSPPLADPITGVGQVDVGVDPWGFKPVVKEELMETLMASGRA